MNFESLYKYQEQVVKFLNNSSKKNRLVHTYLFEGSKGTYKLEAAYYLASLILCNAATKPCLECVECKRIMNENNPNVFLITPEKDVIKKQQIEDLLHEFSLTSLEEGKRIFIIDGIDKATLSAANSLLKFLEESSQNTYGILITENVQNVLSTIKSRSQIINFKKTSKIEVANELIQKGIDEEVAKILSTITNNVDEGLEIIQDSMIIDIIELVKQVGKSIITQDSHPNIIMATKGSFLLKDRNKIYHSIFIDLLITYTNDKLYYILNQKEKITFTSINLLGDNIDTDYYEIIKEVELIMKMKERLKYNVNLELLYIQMFLEIAR